MDLKNINLDLKNINVESIKAKIQSIDNKTLIKFGIGFGSVILFLIIFYTVLNPIVDKKKAQLDNMQKKQAEIEKMNKDISNNREFMFKFCLDTITFFRFVLGGTHHHQDETMSRFDILLYIYSIYTGVFSTTVLYI